MCEQVGERRNGAVQRHDACGRQVRVQRGAHPASGEVDLSLELADREGLTEPLDGRWAPKNGRWAPKRGL